MIDTSLASFERDVIDASMEVPVLLEFWAPWCEPCLAMTPVLERLEREYGGRFRLVNANADDNAELVTSFQLAGIPHVVAFVGGNAIAQFEGAQAEPFLRAFIDRLVPDPSGTEHRLARDALTLGDAELAEAHLRSAIALDPANDAARIDMMAVLLERGDAPAARQHFELLSPRACAHAAYEATCWRLEAAEALAQLPAFDLLQRRISHNPGDLHARRDLAERHIAQGDFEEAMEQLLEIARRDRTFDEDGGRRRLLEVFEMAAADEDLVADYRARLSAIIF
jgi:putative thioredoxin